MSSEWEIARVTGRCAVTGRDLAEGETYYAVLMETAAGLERRDYSVEGWPGVPEGTFCHWKGKIPVKQKRQGPVSLDPELLTHLFVRLEESDSEPMQQLRFVIALLLMRKRRVRMEQTIQQEGRELWQLRLLQDGSLHQVPNPQLSSEQVDRLGTQLLALLSGDGDVVSFMDETGEAATNEAPLQPDESSSQSSPKSERQENLATP